MTIADPEISVNNSVLVSSAKRILGKEQAYKSGIQMLQAANLLFAEKLALGGPIEANLLPSANEDTPENIEIQTFLEEQRNLIKKIARDSVLREKKVDYLLGAVREICDEAKKSDSSHNETSNYQNIISEKMNNLQEHALLATVQVELEDEDHCKELRKRLGEKISKKKRKSRGGTEEESEEELEIMNSATASTQRGPASVPNMDLALKCPITGSLFQEPLKNKLCGHTYSKPGIQHWFANRKTKCPIPGCANHSLTRSQLVDDVEMTLKLQRHSRQLAQIEEQQRIKAAQASEVDDEDADAGITMVH